MTNVRSAVITIYGLRGATALAARSPLTADRLAFSHSAPMHALGVGIGVLSWVPVLVIDMPPMRVVRLGMLMPWFVCMLVAKRYYQRPS